MKIIVIEHKIDKTTATACISCRVLKGKNTVCKKCKRKENINSLVLTLQVIYTLTNCHVGAIIKEIQGTKSFNDPNDHTFSTEDEESAN